jgi:hypothetical protein
MDRPPAGCGPLCQPGRHGGVTAASLERARSRPEAQPLNVAAVHRIEQPRHQRQPLPLTFLMMIKNVLWHAVPASPQLTSPGSRLKPLVRPAYAGTSPGPVAGPSQPDAGLQRPVVTPDLRSANLWPGPEPSSHLTTAVCLQGAAAEGGSSRPCLARLGVLTPPPGCHLDAIATANDHGTTRRQSRRVCRPAAGPAR